VIIAYSAATTGSRSATRASTPWTAKAAHSIATRARVLLNSRGIVMLTCFIPEHWNNILGLEIALFVFQEVCRVVQAPQAIASL
jgi:hypothetical protein